MTRAEAYARTERVIRVLRDDLPIAAEAVDMVLRLAKAHAPCEACNGTGLALLGLPSLAYPCGVCRGTGRGEP